MNEDLKKRFLGEFVYGAIDGTITTFAIITGVVGASLSAPIILILGFSNVFADGFSMGASNYLATKSDRELGKVQTDKPLSNALATFISFVIVGAVPLLPFLLSFAEIVDQQRAITISFVITGFVFLAIGAIKGAITGKNKFYSALETFLIGGVAALISYFVGYFLRGLV